MIRFVCKCGKELQAREENAGKTIICPECQRQLTVPNEPPPLEAVQSERPIRRDDPVWEEEQEGEDRSRHRQPAGTSGKAVASLVLGILSLFCNLLAGLPAFILALLAMRDISRSRGRLSGQGLAIAGIVTACACTLLSCVTMIPISVGLLLPAVQKVREAAAKAGSSDNLRQQSLAMLNYHNTNRHFPAAAVYDAKGKPLLSWRVSLLPYLGYQNLYASFKLDEPWDGPKNKGNIGYRPQVNAYNCPTAPTQLAETVYQVFVGKGAAFEETKSIRMPVDFPDGTSNTILIVEAAQPVVWTKPEDIGFDPKKPIKPLLGKNYPSGFLVLLVDGSVRFVPANVSESTLKAAITRNGGEELGPDW